MNKKNKAFTLIELIVVMAIIGVLVLLAAPRFLDKTQQAKVTKITNDVKVVEGFVEEYLIHHDTLPANGTEKSKAELEALDIYDTTGSTNTANEGPYKLVGDEILTPANTQLKGNFYGNDKGKVYYEDENDSSGGGIETPVEEVIIVPEAAKVSATPIGAGTIVDPYQLWFLENIDYIRTDVASQTSNYVMMRSLDFTNDAHYIDSATNKPLWTTGLGWTPILNFSGVLDGNNKELAKLFVASTADGVGLFDTLAGAVVKDLGLIDVNIVTSGEYVGALASYLYNKAQLINVYSSGNITGGYLVGGLIGGFEDGLISDSHSSATIAGVSEVGGLVGMAENYSVDTGIIDNSFFTGKVSGNESYGGLFGMALSMTIKNSYSTGSVVGTGSYPGQGGGIAGYSEYTDMTKSYSTSDVSGTSSLGGLAGYFAYGEMTDSYAWGNLIDTDGGTAYYNGMVGGLIGSLFMSKVTNSYANGMISGAKGYAGGITGEYTTGVDTVVTNTYYLNQPTGLSGNPIGIKLDASGMANQSSFVGWDFTSVWTMKDGFPVLQ